MPLHTKVSSHICTDKSEPLFSFVIPVRNGESVIEKTIRSIKDQTFKNYEIILVDNGSTDNTKKIVKRIADVKYIYLKKPSRSLARNKGASLAKGTYIAFIDADVVLSKHWLKNAYHYISRLPLDAICTSVIPQQESKNTLDTYRYNFAKWKTKGSFLSVRYRENAIPLINTAACIFSASSFKRAGGFNPSLFRHEDLELSIRMYAQGYLIGATSAAKAYVRFEPNQTNRHRSISYLWRTAEVQYHAIFFKGPTLKTINWSLLQSIIKKQKIGLSVYALSLEGIKYGTAWIKKIYPAKYSIEIKSFPHGRSALSASFKSNGTLYLPKQDTRFLFIDKSLYTQSNSLPSRKLSLSNTKLMLRLFRKKSISPKDSKQLLKLGLFQPLHQVHPTYHMQIK